MKKEKILACALLPIFWIAYFTFELITGRVKDIKQILFNIVFIVLFGLFGFMLYFIGNKLKNGLSKKSLIITTFIFIAIDQIIKVIIKFFYFEKSFIIIKDILSFDPIINTNGSWLNARFGTGVSFTALIMINIIGLFLIVELYRYSLYKGKSGYYLDCSFIFMFSGAICSLIDKLFYGGSLDFIGIIPLFIADIKDIYICIAMFFLVLYFYITGFFNNDEETTLKQDIESVKRFLIFSKKDIFRQL